MSALTPTAFETRTVHAGREDFGSLGVHAPPIDLSTTYPVADLDVGTAFAKATSTNIGAGISGNFGLTWPHRYTRPSAGAQ